MLKYLSIRNIHRNYAPKLSNQEHLNTILNVINSDIKT